MLLHEYQHAYDCVLEQWRAEPTEKDWEWLEIKADGVARANYQQLFGAKSPSHPFYNHATDGDPACI